ncbi:MAG: alpha/beta fold hydrolase [Alphaproteobacteria bacterium]
MRCPLCQTENREGARFCVACGAGMGATCPACGTAVAAGARFCDACGAALPTVRAEAPTPVAAMRAGENVVDIRSAIEGERKQVTVLFADLVGSTRLTEAMDPEESAAFLEPCLDAMIACIRRYQGTVTRAMGDGVVALFGAPLAHEDHATRACYAALDIQRAMDQFGDSVRHRHGEALKARIGLNSGDVVVKAIGDDLHLDYDAIGIPVHLASRMEQAAVPGTIRLTARTLALTRDSVLAEPLGPIPVKGISEPVQAYRLIGVNPGWSRLSAAGARGLSRLVGRDDEMATLDRAFDRVVGGAGQIVAAVGEPGVGKSRLFHEFVRSPRSERAFVLECGAVSFRTSTPWAPVVDLVRRYFAIEDDDDVRRIIDKVTTRVVTLEESLEPSVPALCSLLGVVTGDPAWEALEPVKRRWRVQQAVKALLLREGVARPVVVVFEDLHWADEASLRLIEALVESLAASRLLLLVNFRPEFEHGWANRSAYTRIRIEPLGRDGTETLLDSLLGGDPTLARLKPMIAEQGQGNALFLEEIVQSLVEAGRLEGERGAYRLRGEADALDLPTTIHALIAARIDRLEPGDKKLLCTAAVIGFEVAHPLLLEVAGQSEQAIEASLSRLKSTEFLCEKQIFPETVFAFRHALIHDVTVRGLLKGQRRKLHARVGEAMERLYPSRHVELAESMASHFAEGEVWPKAVQHFLRAVEKSKAQYAIAHAIELCDRALECATRMAGPTEYERRLLVLLGELWSQRDDVAKANGAYERALRITDDARARREIENKVHRQAFATRENGRVAFYKHGRKGRTIVLSSPISYGIALWQPIVERLCQEFRIITIDSRGTGASGPLAPDWTLAEDLEDVRAVVEALGGDPVTVIGISHTGSMVVQFAAMYPHLVEKVVVIAGSFGKSEARGDTSEYLKWSFEMNAFLDRGDYEGAVRQLMYEILPQPEMQDLREEWVQWTVKGTPIEVFRTLLDLEAEISCEPYAKNVRAPTLVIHGTEDLSVPYAHGVYLASIVPGATLYTFHGHGHEPQHTAPAEFCDVLSEFVRTGTASTRPSPARATSSAGP